MSEQLRARVFEIIGKFSPEGPREISPSDRIVDDLGFHSVRVVELTIELELEFGLRPISEEDAAGVETASDLADLVERKLASQKA